MSDFAALPRLILHGKVGMVARFKPVHLGHAVILVKACARAETFLIGIGSAGTYDYKNPFTLEETEAMLRLTLSGFENFEFLAVPDIHNGPKWRERILSLFGKLDYFISANNYVRSLLEDVYTVAHPLRFIDKEDETPITGTAVRMQMARGGDWRGMVPDAVAAYIENNELDERFRSEFGLRTLADLADNTIPAEGGMP